MEEDIFGFSSDYIAIIDVLSETDMQTGRQLNENINDVINAEDSNFSCVRLVCTNKIELFLAFKAIKDRITTNDVIPCIHIEGHGSKVCLELADGSLLTWEELANIMREINIISKNNLFFSSSACMSAYAFNSASINKPTPFFGFLAPEKDIKVENIVKAFSVFYSTLIRGEDLHDSVVAFSEKTDCKQYAYIFSQLLFKRSMRNYIQKSCMGKGKQKKMNELLDEVSNIKTLTLKKKRKILKEEINKPQALFLKKLHNVFMMIDLYPENAERFKFDAVRFEKDIRNDI